MKRLLVGFLLLGCGEGQASPSPNGSPASDAGSGGLLSGAGGSEAAGGSTSAGGVPNNGGQGSAGAASGAAGTAVGGASSASLGEREPNSGPGGPAVGFDEADLYQNCAYLDGGDTDQNHHNSVAMYDGYLVMPWAHEAGGGGIAFFDVSDPCHPTRISSVASPETRETHTVAISNVGGRILIAAQRVPGQGAGGIELWDIADVTEPKPLKTMAITGHVYPNAYDHVVMSTFVQGPYAYLAAGYLGVFIVDIRDPLAPAVVGEYKPEPNMRVMQAMPVGNLLFIHAAESSRAVLLDISNPTSPEPIAGGDFALADDAQVVRNAYAANVNGGYAWFARQSGTGGLLVFDIHDPSAPTFAGGFDDGGGNGGYVFFQGSHAFGGNSNHFSLYDVSNLASITSVTQFSLQGDMDTITPIGNVAILSVDDGAVDDQASAVAPWGLSPDSEPPKVTWCYPADGATGLSTTSRFGVTLSELVDPKSAWRSGSVRLYPTSAGAAASVPIVVSAQDTVVNAVPESPLLPNTEYTLEIVAGGLEDASGNAIVEPFTAGFTTGG